MSASRGRTPADLIRQLSADREPILDVDLFLSKLIDTFGGVDEFCKLMLEDYKASKPGSKARARIIAIIHQVVFRVAETREKARLDFNSLETEDLSRMLEDFIRQRMPDLVVREPTNGDGAEDKSAPSPPRPAANRSSCCWPGPFLPHFRCNVALLSLTTARYAHIMDHIPLTERRCFPALGTHHAAPGRPSSPSQLR